MPRDCPATKGTLHLHLHLHPETGHGARSPAQPGVGGVAGGLRLAQKAPGARCAGHYVRLPCALSVPGPSQTGADRVTSQVNKRSPLLLKAN